MVSDEKLTELLANSERTASGANKRDASKFDIAPAKEATVVEIEE